MGIIVSDLSYSHPNQQPLFNHLYLSVEPKEKVSIVGLNGAGKSTLLKLIAGELQPSNGIISISQKPYYVPQHAGKLSKTIAEALGIDKKLAALHAIENGSVEQSNYDTLADDWDIETRSVAALAYWQLQHVTLAMQIDTLSGGEKTKVYLAGCLIHAPEIVLLDEPTNHLDHESRELLYQFIEQSKASMIIVSHDITLLNQLTITYELSEFGLKRYGGNYNFYKEQKNIAVSSLNENIHEQEKQLRLAHKKAQDVRQRQEKRSSQGEKKKAQGGMPRIVVNALAGAAENTASKLKDKHTEIIIETQAKLSELRQQRERLKELKIDFDNTSLHAGKLLVEAVGINFSYAGETPVWKNPINFRLFSNDRIQLIGKNGAGKTTFIKLLTGELMPASGAIQRANFHWIYLDQDYTLVNINCTIEELAEKYNVNNLLESEVKIRLNRFLFPFDTWDRNCLSLSGGEKMRLYLCCLMISNQTPDLIILDEPTNNLDIANLQILTQTIKNYKGSVLVVSHDRYFIDEIGVAKTLAL